MPMDLEELLKRHDYDFPVDRIAQAPASPRDSARLLVYDRTTGRTEFSTFRSLRDFLSPGAVLVMNDTKVLPARLMVTKKSGGRIRILYVKTEGKHLRFLADRKLESGAELTLSSTISFTVLRRVDGAYLLRPSFPISKLYPVLERYGIAPLPPYIKHSSLSTAEAKKKYQTVFARVRGSVAAPTASLHFTSRLLKTLKRTGVEIRYVTLHVNLGTFAPLTEEKLRAGRLHDESYAIDKETAVFLNRAKREGRPIIAVGTTVVRTLESACDAAGKLRRLEGRTDLFIREGYRFGFIDGLITNLHVPRSSLLMLVAAFVARKKILELYGTAIGRGFKLFSFGDGMLIK